MTRHPMLMFQRLRADKGVLMRTVATACGVTPATVSKWDWGRERMPNSAFDIVVDLLGLDTGEQLALNTARMSPLVTPEQIAADRAETRRAIDEGRMFVSYAHSGASNCPCNSCRFERDAASPVRPTEST